MLINADDRFVHWRVAWLPIPSTTRDHVVAQALKPHPRQDQRALKHQTDQHVTAVSPQQRRHGTRACRLISASSRPLGCDALHQLDHAGVQLEVLAARVTLDDRRMR